MKKGLRKLILSGTALAAVAATLGTSTYAWYTANDTVSATGINGASADTGNSSIFISRDTKKWAQSVELQADDLRGGELIPVEFFNKTVGTDAADYSYRQLGTESSQTRVAVPYTQDEIDEAKNNAADYCFRSAGTYADADAFAAGKTEYTKLYTFDNTKVGEARYTEAATFGTAATVYYYKTATTYAQAQDIFPVSKKTTSDNKVEASSQTYVMGATPVLVNGGACLQFTLHFKSSNVNTTNLDEVPNLYLKTISVKNTESSLANYETDSFVLGRDGSYVGGVDTSQGVYAVDIVDALAMRATVAYNSGAQVAGKDASVASEDSASTTKYYNAYNSYNYAYDLGTEVTSLGTESINSADALGYYNAVMDKTLVRADNERQTLQAFAASGTDAKLVDFGKVPHDNKHYMSVTFEIFLNGWDEYCYDACKGQTFDVELSFTSTKENAMHRA